MTIRAGRDCIGVALSLVALTGCDDHWAEQRIRQIKAERRAADPASLWSMQVLSEGQPGKPLLICANSRIVSGFAQVTPASGGRPCEREPADGEILPTEHGSRYRCHLNGTVFAVSAGLVGDRTKDFVVSASVHPLTGEGADYARDMRFRRIGPCPAGWTLGEATDRNGKRAPALDPDQIDP
jgi:hypothetical protein